MNERRFAFNPSKVFRMLPALVAGLSLITSPVEALQKASVLLANQDFGNGNLLVATSGRKKIDPDKQYTYRVSGTCQGTGDLAKLVPAGTKVGTFMNSIAPGASLYLTGTLANPSGKLPAVLLNRRISGSEVINGIGKVSVSVNLKIEILRTGRIVARISEVRFKSPTGKIPGTIRFARSAKITLSVPADGLENVNLSMAGAQFGHGKSLIVKSGKETILPSMKYAYQVGGSCQGTGDLAKLVPAGTDLGAFMESFSPGSSSHLDGTLGNLSGRLPVVLINRNVSGSRNMKGVGKVLVSMKLRIEILPGGEIAMQLGNVSIKSVSGAIAGTIRFSKGAKLVVSTAPAIGMETLFQNVRERAGFIEIKVVRAGSRKPKTTVRYETSGISAVAGKDFSAKSGTIRFASGQTEQSIIIPIFNNAKRSGLPRFEVKLSDPGGISMLGPWTTTVVGIQDDE